MSNISVDYNKYIDILAELNHFISIIEDGYQWREISSIELNLRELSGIDESQVLEDISNKMYEKGYWKK